MNFSNNYFKNSFDEYHIHFCFDLSQCNKCEILYKVPSTRYLSLIFDCNMRWSLDIRNLVTNSNTFNYSFHKLKYFMPTNTMRTIYLALYHNIFQYSSLALGGLSEHALRLLQLH